MQFVAGICKRCRIDHLGALQTEQSAEDLRTEQYEPPDQVQSNVLLSFSVHTPDPFLSPAPLVADDVESPLEVPLYYCSVNHFDRQKTDWICCLVYQLEASL